MTQPRRLAPLGIALLFVAGCLDNDGPAADAGRTDVARQDGAPDGAASTVTVPLTIADYPGASGKLLLAPVSVNGSPTVNVLLDTGSSGLRVLAAALGGTNVTTTTEATLTQFGGEILTGHKASGRLTIGGVTAPGEIDFDLVEKISCIPNDPYCDPATVAKEVEDAGIQGVMGIGLRGGSSGIVSPLPQLGAPLSRGFTLRTGGFGAKTGELVLGAAELPGAATITLKSAGALPGGATAWADDQIQLCYRVNDADTDPPCSEAVLDTGSNLDVIHARNLPASAITADGLLAPGVTFEVSHADGFTMKLTVGSPITWSLDGILVDDQEAFTILGLGVFFRHDVAFDLGHGKIGLLPR